MAGAISTLWERRRIEISVKSRENLARPLFPRKPTLPTQNDPLSEGGPAPHHQRDKDLHVRPGATRAHVAAPHHHSPGPWANWARPSWVGGSKKLVLSWARFAEPCSRGARWKWANGRGWILQVAKAWEQFGHARPGPSPLDTSSLSAFLLHPLSLLSPWLTPQSRPQSLFPTRRLSLPLTLLARDFPAKTVDLPRLLSIGTLPRRTFSFHCYLVVRSQSLLVFVSLSALLPTSTVSFFAFIWPDDAIDRSLTPPFRFDLDLDLDLDCRRRHQELPCPFAKIFVPSLVTSANWAPCLGTIAISTQD